LADLARKTWPIVTGCDRVSAGCDSCPSWQHYLAEDLDYSATPQMQFLTIPARDQFSKIYCVAFGSDLFHYAVPTEDIESIFEVMGASEQHVFELVTKRIERAHRLKLDWPDNVLAGVVIESADYTSRLDHLREIPARFKFLSAAPLLGPLGDIDLTGIDQVGAVHETWGLKRPCKQQWIDDLREQCDRQGVEFVTDAYGWRFH